MIGLLFKFSFEEIIPNEKLRSVNKKNLKSRPIIERLRMEKQRETELQHERERMVARERDNNKGEFVSIMILGRI